MRLLRVYSIIVMLFTLFVYVASDDVTKEGIVLSGILYVPVLAYLLCGGW